MAGMKLRSRTLAQLVGRRSLRGPRLVLAPKDAVDLAAAIRGVDDADARARRGALLHAGVRKRRRPDRPLRFCRFPAGECHCADGDVRRRNAVVGRGSGAPSAGLALKNMGDIDRQTLGGVVGTGTHGTGATSRASRREVMGFQLMLANGQVLNCTLEENTEVFAAGRCSLGTLGVMTEITMQVRPAYKLVEKNFLLAPDGTVSRSRPADRSEPAFRVLLVSLCRSRGVQEPERNR